MYLTVNCIDNDIFPGNVVMLTVLVPPNAKVDVCDTGSALTLVDKGVNWRTLWGLTSIM